MHAEFNKLCELERSVSGSRERVYRLSVQLARSEKDETRRLPTFKPIKLSEVLRTIKGASSRKITTDVTLELIRRIDAQQAKLLQALDLDPNNPDWAEAFVSLAGIHHGVGVIQIEKARAPNKHATKWAPGQDNTLLAAMNARLDKGMTATAALKEIATDKTMWQQFPRVENSRSQKPPAFRRMQTYRKRWGLIKKVRLLDSIQSAMLDGLLTQPAATKQKTLLKKPSRSFGKI